MPTKWLLASLIIMSLIALTSYIAKKLVRTDNKEVKKEVEKGISEDAQKTIEEAKKWIEEDNEWADRGNKTTENNGGDIMGDKLNNHTLGELLSLEPTEEDYRNYVRVVGNKVKGLYEEYQFFMYEPDKRDLASGFLLQFQIMGIEPVYNELFVHAMDTGLEMDKIDEFFLEELKEGNIIPIGEGIILEEEGTGISPIKSGDDVRVIISFVTEEYRARQDEKEAEEKAEKEAEAKKDE